MKTGDEDQQLAETRRKLERLREKSNFEVGPITWNRDELYEDRIPPGFKHSNPDGSGKNNDLRKYVRVIRSEGSDCGCDPHPALARRPPPFRGR